MFTFDELRATSTGTEFSNIRVRAVKDLYCREDGEERLHIAKGTRGDLRCRTNAGFLVLFDEAVVRTYNGYRQVFDFQGEECLYKAEDEIELGT